MAERVLVIGAGMAGLWCALALSPTGREVTLLERDPPPPAGGPDVAFDDWQRRGVGHLRHSHAFLARLHNLIRDEHPALLAELKAEGCRELPFVDGLTSIHLKSYQRKPVDDDLSILTSRRTTLELVMRRYVERLPNATIRSGTFVKALEIAPGSPPTVTGVRLEDGEVLTADLVIDAAGRTSGATEQLAAAGVAVPEEFESTGVLYFTRHYRLQPGQSEPPRSQSAPATGDLDFLKFGVFPADNGCFSITLCLPEVELELRKAIVDPKVFDAICNALPGLVPWVDPERAQPISRVFGMGELNNRWRDFAPGGKPAVLGFFAVGDALARTNPLYGRGCSFAAVGACLVRETLAEATDPGERLVRFQAKAKAELRPYYEAMRNQDRSAIKRARQALTPGYKPSLRRKILTSFVEDAITVAMRSDVELLRAAMRGFHMLEHPQAWLRRPGNLAKVLGYWARGKKANAEAYRPKAGPPREEMMARLGLPADADLVREAA
jgi:2-polyprenyl-6-methoxyphenol hydroxylase-like FAD-dependent oxidoreductase